MTNDGWGKDWPVVLSLSNSSTIIFTGLKEEIKSLDVVDLVWIDFGSEPSKSFIGNRELKPQGSNLVDDESYLYFQCEGCQKILDPNTKSFKTLNDKRFEAGWKVKWNVDGMGYKVYCVECGEKSE